MRALDGRRSCITANFGVSRAVSFASHAMWLAPAGLGAAASVAFLLRRRGRSDASGSGEDAVRQKQQAERKARRERLAQLRDLLRAAVAAQAHQRDLRDKLVERILLRLPDTQVSFAHNHANYLGFVYTRMTAEEHEAHNVLRALTIDELKPKHEALRAWLKAETFFTEEHLRIHALEGLHTELADLSCHLDLWMAKFEATVAQDVKRGIVQLTNSDGYGCRWPAKLAGIVDNALETF